MSAKLIAYTSPSCEKAIEISEGYLHIDHNIM